MPFISAFLYKGARNSSSRSSSGGAKKTQYKLSYTFYNFTNSSPFGMTPGSIKVASEKLAMTKNVTIPCIAGTYGCFGQ